MARRQTPAPFSNPLRRVPLGRTVRASMQEKLFDMPEQLPSGLIYHPHFITREEEDVLLAYLSNLPLRHPVYAPKEDDAASEQYRAKRRVRNFGWDFDAEREAFIPGPPLPSFLAGLQRKIAKWLGIENRRVAEALVNEYPPGSQIGWHRDREPFEHIVGISLGSWCRIRFRPLTNIGQRDAVVSIEAERRSAYLMQGSARWRWQHSVAAVPALRYSVTFRTLPASIQEAGQPSIADFGL